MVEVKKDTILVASIKRRKKQTNKEGKTIMSSSDAVTKSFSVSHSGIFGVDEKSRLEILDERFPFEKCDEILLKFLKREFKRFKDAVVKWTMHPWERDARMARKALKRGSQAYGYSLNLHEDVACRVDGIQRQVIQTEGSRKNDVAIESNAQKLNKAIRNGDKTMLIKDEEIVRILTTRSKPHLEVVFKCYYDDFGKDIVEDLGEESGLKDTIYCLCAPPAYFSKDIVEEYNKQYGTPQAKKLEDVALGNYKDFLVTLVQRALAKGSE
ncbi:hypothetical protein AAG906_000932 [Vitis piasezkii]